MKVLVTGGAGFIGSHLVELLSRQGDEVRVLDDLSTGSSASIVRESGAELVVGDVADPAAVSVAVAGCDAVCHLAAVASVAASIERPLETLRTNVTGSVTVFAAAASAGVARVVYASSAAVYGAAQELPLRETLRPQPLSPYAADKLAGEHYLGHFHRSGVLGGHAFRFFNVYGPRQDPRSPYSGVISIFLDRAVAGEPLVVNGDGEQTRDFVYVGDVVELLARALHGEAQGEAEEMPVTNLGRGESVSVRELAEAVGLVAAGTPQKVKYGPPRSGDVKHSRADVTLLNERFGGVPPTSLEAGLRATLAAARVRRAV